MLGSAGEVSRDCPLRPTRLLGGLPAPYRFLGIGALRRRHYAGAWAVPNAATSPATPRQACSMSSSASIWAGCWPTALPACAASVVHLRPAAVLLQGPGVLSELRGAPDDRARRAPGAGRGGAGSPRSWTWAALMRRAFDLGVLRCPRCAGRMQLIATIEDPAVIQRIRAHLGFPGTRDDPQPPCSMTAAGPEQPTLPGVTV
jgi:hypothetical protein